MHAGCQWVGNLTLSPNCADSTRLVTFWQLLKLAVDSNSISDPSYSQTARYTEITAVQTLSVTDYPVTEKVLIM